MSFAVAVIRAASSRGRQAGNSVPQCNEINVVYRFVVSEADGDCAARAPTRFKHARAHDGPGVPEEAVKGWPAVVAVPQEHVPVVAFHAMRGNRAEGTQPRREKQDGLRE